MLENRCLIQMKKNQIIFRDHVITYIFINECVFTNLQENGISCIHVKLNHINLYFLLLFWDKNNELYHRVLMLHIINFDLISNNKELKYIYFIQERDLKYSCKGGEKTILTGYKFSVSCLRYLTWLSVLYKKKTCSLLMLKEFKNKLIRVNVKLYQYQT